MNRNMKVLTALFLILAAVPASATLIGDTIDARWRYAPQAFDQTENLLVGPGVEIAAWAGSDAVLDISASSIEIDFVNPLATNIAVNPGVNWTFTDLDWVGMTGHITGVSVTTNYTNWDDGFITYGDDWIDVFFADFVILDDLTTDTFVIGIDTAHAPIPEPMSLALLGLGVAGVAVRRRLLA